MKTELWKKFVSWWTVPIKDEQDPEWPKLTYPTNMVAQCDLNFKVCLGLCEIYITEMWSEDDVRHYCRDCYIQREDELSSYEEPSQAEIVYWEKKNFIKFYRNWHFGIIDNQQISKYNNTCWTDEELMEIFPILQMYIQMDNEYANKLDNHMASWKNLAEEIINWR
jgi:hypothetical protein